MAVVPTVCQYCGKDFKRAWNLERHQKAKRKCVPLAMGGEAKGDRTHMCKFCGRYYTHASGLTRHVNTTCSISPRAGNPDGMDRLYDIIANQAARLDALELRLSDPGAGSSARPITQQIIARDGIQNVGIDQHTETHIHIGIFGKEDLSHIDRARIRALLDEIIPPKGLPAAYMPKDAIVKTAMIIYSDPDKPENLTCYLPNKKTGEVMVHGAEGWEMHPIHLVTPQMARTSMDLLFDQQPIEEDYAQIMRDLVDNEKRYVTESGPMKTILIRNKALLARVLASLPVEGNK